MKPLFSLILLERWIEIENLIKQKIVSQFEVQIKNSFLGLLNPIWPCIVRFLMVLHQKQDVKKYFKVNWKISSTSQQNLMTEITLIYIIRKKYQYNSLFSTSTLTLFMPKGKRRGAIYLPGSLMAGALECFTIHISPIK